MIRGFHLPVVIFNFRIHFTTFTHPTLSPILSNSTHLYGLEVDIFFIHDDGRLGPQFVGPKTTFIHRVCDFAGGGQKFKLLSFNKFQD